MASLFVIQGADQGKRFELQGRPTALGRDGSNPIRLHDNEVSRRHAEVRPIDERSFRIVDLDSANGTFLNGRPVDDEPLHSGDQVRLGRTVMLFSEGPAPAGSALTERVDLLGRASAEDRSAIVRSIPAGEASRVLEAPAEVGEWLKVRLANLAVMYQATQAVSHILDTDELLPRVLQLVFESIGADRAAVLMAEPSEEGPDQTRTGAEGRPLAGRGRPRRADDHLAVDRRPRPADRPGGDLDRRPGRRAVQRRAIHRRLWHPRGDLRSDPGAALDARRALRRPADRT